MSKDKKKDKVEEPKKPKTKKAKKATEAPAAVAEVAIESTPAEPKPAPKPKATKPKAPSRVKKAPPAPEIEISIEEIGLRAYFISERRRNNNLPGDETSDWVEAERELRFEIIEKLGINS